MCSRAYRLLRATWWPRCRWAAETWPIFLSSLHLGLLSFERQVLSQSPPTRSLHLALSGPGTIARHACPLRLSARSTTTTQPVPTRPYACAASCRLRRAAAVASSQTATDWAGTLRTWRQPTSNSDSQSRFRGTVSILRAGRASSSTGPYCRRGRERALRPFDCVQCLDRPHLAHHEPFGARSELAHTAHGWWVERRIGLVQSESVGFHPLWLWVLGCNAY